MKQLALAAGAAALLASTSVGALAQSGSIGQAVGGYSFDEAAQEAPGTKDFNSNDGVLTFAIVTHTAGNGFFDPVYVGATVAANMIGAKVLLLGSESPTDDPAREIEILNQIINDPTLDGLIMMSHLGESIFRYAQTKVPYIVGIDSGYGEIDNIEYDHEQAARMAVEYLAGKGHREIGFIGGGEGEMDMRRCRRYHSYADTMKDLGLDIRDEWVLDCEWNDVTCTRLVADLGRDNLPRSFFATSDLMAMAALRALDNMRVSVPDQVAVIGLTNIEMSKYANPPLTTINIPTEAMGEAAARTLLSRIKGDASLPRRILFPCEYIVRDSA